MVTLLATRAQRGMAVWLSADFVFFLAMFCWYMYLRAQAPVWHTEFHFASGLMAAAISLFTLAASVTMFYATEHQARDSYEISMRLVVATLAVWAAVVILLGMEWVRLLLILGIGFTDSPFSATYFTLSGIYLMHVLAGIVYAGAVAARIKTADAGAAALYVHVTNLIWLFLFFGVYLPSTDLQGI